MNLHLPGVAWAAMGMLSSLCIAAGSPTVTPARQVRHRAYATAHDKPLDAVQSVVQETETYTSIALNSTAFVPACRESVTFQRRKKSHPAVLLQYAAAETKTQLHRRHRLKAVEHGFVVITIDIPIRRAQKQNRAANAF